MSPSALEQTSKKLLLHDLSNSIGVIYTSLHLIESQHPEVNEFKHWKETITDLENLRTLLQQTRSL